MKALLTFHSMSADERDVVVRVGAEIPKAGELQVYPASFKSLGFISTSPLLFFFARPA